MSRTTVSTSRNRSVTWGNSREHNDALLAREQSAGMTFRRTLYNDDCRKTNCTEPRTLDPPQASAEEGNVHKSRISGG